ncbi:CLUMA_CG004366, isoform A [Clunio marinus]|uniref:CLUMA_CG004366, isoform A n=1 Tax=Clunio marinus TaxID=568069 RepID=A0A1J1HX08_9DIPT|nr:CLUMA_CG004366, isoform A [Clunio marinus]
MSARTYVKLHVNCLDASIRLRCYQFLSGVLIFPVLLETRGDSGLFHHFLLGKMIKLTNLFTNRHHVAQRLAEVMSSTREIRKIYERKQIF